MTRLQRSMVRSRVSVVGKDSTVNAGVFLFQILEIFQEYLKHNIKDTSNLKARQTNSAESTAANPIAVPQESTQCNHASLVGHISAGV